MMRPQPLQDLMIRVGEKARLMPVPERYMWIAVWWHMHAKETMMPGECLGYARWQLRLARDMRERPEHYSSKPSGKTDWEWSKVPA